MRHKYATVDPKLQAVTCPTRAVRPKSERADLQVKSGLGDSSQSASNPGSGTVFCLQIATFVGAEAGVDTMSFHLAFGDIEAEHTHRTAELFAAEVMPAFADVAVRS